MDLHYPPPVVAAQLLPDNYPSSIPSNPSSSLYGQLLYYGNIGSVLLICCLCAFCLVIAGEVYPAVPFPPSHGPSGSLPLPPFAQEQDGDRKVSALEQTGGHPPQVPMEPQSSCAPRGDSGDDSDRSIILRDPNGGDDSIQSENDHQKGPSVPQSQSQAQSVPPSPALTPFEILQARLANLQA